MREKEEGDRKIEEREKKIDRARKRVRQRQRKRKMNMWGGVFSKDVK